MNVNIVYIIYVILYMLFDCYKQKQYYVRFLQFVIKYCIILFYLVLVSFSTFVLSSFPYTHVDLLLQQ